MPRRLGQGTFSDDEVEWLFQPLAAVRTVGLAISGGPDSLGLMLLAARWARLGPHDLPMVYTLDHGLRPEAAAEVAMVVHEATRLGLPVRALRWDGDKPATGVQAAARAARYRLIGAAMRRDGVEALVTAHHIEDQAETVLMRLAHGSGIEGLAGMEPDTEVEGVRVLRPLLGVPRARLAAEVAAADLVAADDPSNSNDSYERVRWRQALPALAELGLTVDRLATFARRATDTNAVIEAMSIEAGADLIVHAEGGVLHLRRDGFLDLQDAVAVRLLARLVEAVGYRAPQLSQVEALSAELRTANAFQGRTLAGTTIRLTAETIVIAVEPLTGARARHAEALTQQASLAGQPGPADRQFAEIDTLTGGGPPLYRPHVGPTFAKTPRQPQTAGTLGQD